MLSGLFDFVVLWLFLFSIDVAACQTDPEYLIGINYFAGWWRPKPNKWFEPWNQTVDWRNLYPGRVPLLGDYNDQQTMDREIVAASSYGIDFFQILYYDNLPTEREPNSHFLNRGLSNFINSPESSRMKFYISWCNEADFMSHNLVEFQNFVWSDWVPAFRHPSYLRIDGKLVIKVISASNVMVNCNHSTSCVKLYFDTLRAIVKKAVPGSPDLLIGGGIGAAFHVSSETQLGFPYDWTGTYMDVPQSPLAKYPWSKMSEWTIQNRAVHVDDAIMYMPYLPVGWDPTPWREKRPSYDLPTWQEWVDDLFQVKKDLDLNPNFGIPNGQSTRQKIFNIYAWNEFGEGGYVAPVKALGYGRLQAIKNVFKR